MKKLFRSKWFWIALVLILTIGGVAFAKGKKGTPPEFSSSKLEKKTLIQTVQETGSVKSDLVINYGWESSGRVVQIKKKVGDTVKIGEIIASIDSARERNALSQAVASLQGAQARLDQELAGPNEENRRKSLSTVEQAVADLRKAEATADISITAAEKSVETAENNLRLSEGGNQSQLIQDAYADLVDTLKSTVTTLSDALNEGDLILGVDNQAANNDFENQLGNLDLNSVLTARLSYEKAKQNIRALEQPIVTLNPSLQTEVDVKTVEVQGALQSIQKMLVDIQFVLLKTVPGNTFTQDELDTLKTNITTKQGGVNTAAAAVTTDVQAITTARQSATTYQIAFAKAQADLENTKKDAAATIARAEAAVTQAEATHEALIAVPRDVDLAALRAEVSRTRAGVSDAQSNLAKTALKALANGTIAALDVELGENVTANSPVVKIISKDLSLDVDISETDIAKIQLSDEAEITLDAFGDERIFAGTVAEIKPAEKEISGVVYYTTTIIFATSTPTLDVKPGMTANVKIMTDSKDNVLVVPERAVIEKDNRKLVKVLTDAKTGAYTETEVQTGLHGDNGEVEITSGLQEGQEVITFIKETQK